MKNYKRKIQFIDASNNLATLEIKITNYFSICAEYQCSGGQCLDRINPKTKEQKLLINLWKKYHLKSNYPKHLENIVEKLCDIIDIEFEETRIDNKQSDEDLLKLVQSLNLDLEDNFYIACIKNFDLSIEDLRNIEENSDHEYSIQGIDYLICDDETAEEKFNEAVESYIDECVFSQMPEQYHCYFDTEKFINDCRYDGRGRELNYYDGNEEDQTVFGETFYFYRRG